MITHLSMEQLLAVRDGDRSEPVLAEAHRHLAECAACQAELNRLHQRTARLRALATMTPGRDQFPAVKARLHWEQSHTRQRRLATLGLSIAACFLIAVVGRHLLAPPTLDAEQQLETAMSNSQLLEQRLRDWKPDSRVLDGATAEVVMQLEDKIAALDAELARAGSASEAERLEKEVALWQQRVGLMNALVEVHVTKASNVDL
jgi:predicted anti-sigma-YlaC factor YlaD